MASSSSNLTKSSSVVVDCVGPKSVVTPFRRSSSSSLPPPMTVGRGKLGGRLGKRSSLEGGVC